MAAEIKLPEAEATQSTSERWESSMKQQFLSAVGQSPGLWEKRDVLGLLGSHQAALGPEHSESTGCLSQKAHIHGLQAGGRPLLPVVRVEPSSAANTGTLLEEL